MHFLRNTANKKIIVYGGQGALGRACINLFKLSNSWVANIDYFANDQADANINVSESCESCAQQEIIVMKQLADILKSEKVHAIICVAGGWVGGHTSSLSKQIDQTWKQSVWPSSISAIIASKYLLPGGVLALTGARSALKPTPGMIGYGMSKAAVHQLTKSLSDKEFGLPKNCLTVAILPTILDTEMNRKMMPKADHSSWTPVTYVAQLFLKWIKSNERPPNGSLISLVTKHNITELKFEDNNALIESKGNAVVKE